MRDTKIRSRHRVRRGHGAELRPQIQDLLVETGEIHAVTVRAIAERIGVTPPAIYRHFDKDAVVDSASQALVQHHMQLTAEDRALLILTLFRVNAIMLSIVALLTVGASAVILPRFDPRTF